MLNDIVCQVPGVNRDAAHMFLSDRVRSAKAHIEVRAKLVRIEWTRIGPDQNDPALFQFLFSIHLIFLDENNKTSIKLL